jgi:iron-sulfur cluster repair protein YtfE (RIC family)
MSIQDTISQMISRNLRQHQETADQAAQFDTGLVTRDIEGLIIQVKPTVEILRQNLRGHFEREETWFFPAALLGKPDYQLTRRVLELQHDHGALLRDLDDFTQSLEEGSLETEFITQADLERLQAFLKKLRTHAAKELAHVYGLFEEAGPALSALGEVIQENPPADDHVDD